MHDRIGALIFRDCGQNDETQSSGRRGVHVARGQCHDGTELEEGDQQIRRRHTNCWTDGRLDWRLLTVALLRGHGDRLLRFIRLGVGLVKR